MKVGYVVSRFPHVSETFVVREMTAVEAAEPSIALQLYSLFPPTNPTLHPSAEPWLARHHRARLAAGLRAYAGWLARRPLRVLSSTAIIAAAHARRPALLLKAMTTLVLAAEHARTVRRSEVDHVHAYFASLPALGAWLCHRLAGVPFSFDAHAYDVFLDRTLLHRKLSDAAFVVAGSEYVQALLEPYGGGATPVLVLHAGIDPRNYRFRAGRLPATGPVRAICVASLQEYKGHRFLLDAVAGVPDLRLELVGNGPLRPELEHQAAKLGIADRVVFHGELGEDRVKELYEDVHLCVLASVKDRHGLMEGLPVALVEGLACGLATVSTRLSGIPELVRDGETGLLAEPGDAESLTDALRRTIADPAAADARAHAGRRLVEEEFDVRAVGARMAAMFSDAQTGRPTAAAPAPAPDGQPEPGAPGDEPGAPGAVHRGQHQRDARGVGAPRAAGRLTGAFGAQRDTPDRQAPQGDAAQARDRDARHGRGEHEPGGQHVRAAHRLGMAPRGLRTVVAISPVLAGERAQAVPREVPRRHLRDADDPASRLTDARRSSASWLIGHPSSHPP